MAGIVIFDVSFAWSVLPLLAAAAVVTVEATALGYALALATGLALALGRRHGAGPIRAALGFVVEFVRSTPLLVQVFFLYFVMPKFGIRLPAFETGIAALALHYGAYCSEVFRAGLEGVARGQHDAAAALGLGRILAYRLVIIPQAVPPMVPALGNYLILMLKDTPLLSAISVLELMQTAKLIGSEYFRYLEPLTIVAVFFLGLSLCGAAAITRLERRFRIGAARRS